MDGPIVAVSEVSKKYLIHKQKNPVPGFSDRSEFWALRNISFELYRGDVLGIVGNNGAGKTTLLKLMSGIARPSHGTIKIVGRSASILDSGLGFHDELTGRENIFLSGCLLGLKKKDILQKLDEIISFSEIENFIDSPVKHYSTGMFLRLASSITLALDVDVLMIDEHLFSGDIHFRQKVVEKINSKLNEGLTVLNVSHSVNETLSFCNKCMLIENGEIVHFDTPGKVIVKYIGGSLLSSSEKTQQILSPSVEWDEEDAPHSDAIRLRQIAVKPANDTLTKIALDDAFKIRVLFEKLISDVTVQLHIVFLDQFKNPLFSSDTFNNAALEKENNIHKPASGLFAFELDVPPHFLYKGTYSIQLRFGINEINEDLIYFAPISFSIGASDSVHDYIKDSLPISIRPLFNWSLKKV